MNPPPYNAIIHGKILQVSILNIAIALTSWTKAIYIEREPQSHVGNLCNYTWDKGSCSQGMSASKMSKGLNYNNMAKRFNLKNKQGNFYKYYSGTPEHLRSNLHL